MAATLTSYSLHGLNAVPISLEVEVANGMPYFSIIGMASASVQEAKERVRSAIRHSGFQFPMTRKVVNLAPAEISKKGSHFDVAIALGFLVATGQMQRIPEDVMVIGELGLEGGVREVNGILPGLIFAKENGFRQVVLPVGNVHEACLVEELDLIPVKSLREVVDHFEGQARAPSQLEAHFEEVAPLWDFADISGHHSAKRALMIAAAGGHHLMMSGPPGTGKSVLARAFPSVLPPLGRQELLEVLRIYSVAGRSINHNHLSRPFRRIHQSCTSVGLIGGGSDLKPGEVSLAHRGILFMDEFAEFPRSTLESLREPLEEKSIILRRNHQVSEYPCEFQLIAAMNPCPCGHYGDPQTVCVCTAAQISKYSHKLSGPILDRIDMHIEVPRIPFDELKEERAESSTMVRERVVAARELQFGRLSEHGLYLNQEMPAKLVKAEKLSRKSKSLLKDASKKYHLSGRGIFKVMRVARTIADLSGSDTIETAHLMESMQYRVKA